MSLPLHRLCAGTLLFLSLLPLEAQEIITAAPTPDPVIAEAPAALQTARASLASRKALKAAQAYESILILRKVAAAYGAKGDARQSTLYYRETLRLLKLLAATAPSFQAADVTRNIQEIETTLAATPAGTPAEKGMEITLSRASIQNGHLLVEWKVLPPDLSPDEIERHLTFAITMKQRDGSTLKKPKMVESLFLPSPTGEPHVYVASQDYICPPTVKSVLLGVEFFDTNIFQQSLSAPDATPLATPSPSTSPQ